MLSVVGPTRAVQLFCAFLWLLLSSSGLAAQGYLDFSVYKALRDLAPELPEARLHSGLAPAGYELWERGELRMPAEGYFLRADLRQTGMPDHAILLEEPAGDKPAVYILIASLAQGSWSRLFLEQLEEGTALIRWDAERRAIEIPSGEGIRVTSPAMMSWGAGTEPHATYGYAFDVKKSAYVRWDNRARRFEYIRAAQAPFHPWLLRANLDSYGDLAPGEFTGVHIRVSRLRPRRGSSSTLFLFSPGYAPNPAFFDLYHRWGEESGSEDKNFRTLVLSVRQLQEVISALRHLASLEAVMERREPDTKVEFAVSLLRVDEDPRFCELLLTRQDAELLESKVEMITGRQNPLGLEQKQEERRYDKIPSPRRRVGEDGRPIWWLRRLR